MARQYLDRLRKLDPFSTLVALPPVVGAIAWLGALALTGATGTHPVWNLQPRNIAEAAAFQDSGALVRMVNAGDDPDRPGEVRGGVILPAAATLAPIVAAAGSRELTMVQLLLDVGASLDANTWQRAWCISDADSVRELLTVHRPEGALAECVADVP
ncbi:MAG: hypothetical protein O2930_07805 [Acidobacteria bacterium]|nr:hypothetical protein [Acidobacteriota bacterium]